MLAVGDEELKENPFVRAGDRVKLPTGEIVTLRGSGNSWRYDDEGNKYEVGPSEALLFYSLNGSTYLAAVSNRLICEGEIVERAEL